MKILFLADAKSVHTRRWIEYFIQKEYDVSLISYQFYQPFFNDKMDYYYIRIFDWLPKSIRYVLPLVKTRRIIRFLKPDIIHSHWASSYGLAGAFSRYHPFILSVWGGDIFRVPNQNIISKNLIVWILKSANAISATSSYLAEITKRLLDNPPKIHIIPFGVNLQRFTPNAKTQNKQKVVIGTIRSLETAYGIEYLIKAFSMLSARFPHIQLYIIGRGPLLGDLMNLSESLAIKDRVNFYGFIEHHLIPEYLGSMDIFVIPSIVPETFGVAAVEAAAMEIPVVASNIGGLPEVVLNRKTGYLVEPRNVEELCKALEELIENKEKRLKMGKEGRKWIEKNYNWDENAYRMEALYKKVKRDQKL